MFKVGIQSVSINHDVNDLYEIDVDMVEVV